LLQRFGLETPCVLEKKRAGDAMSLGAGAAKAIAASMFSGSNPQFGMRMVIGAREETPRSIEHHPD